MINRKNESKKLSVVIRLYLGYDISLNLRITITFSMEFPVKKWNKNQDSIQDW